MLNLLETYKKLETNCTIKELGGQTEGVGFIINEEMKISWSWNIKPRI